MTEQHALVTFPATEDLEDFENNTTHSADLTVRWAALHRDNQNNRTVIFTEDDAGPIALQAALTILNRHPQAGSPLSDPTHWSPHQRRKLVSIALDSWHYGTGLPLYPALILESYSKGELDFIRVAQPTGTRRTPQSPSHHQRHTLPAIHHPVLHGTGPQALPYRRQRRHPPRGGRTHHSLRPLRTPEYQKQPHPRMARPFPDRPHRPSQPSSRITLLAHRGKTRPLQSGRVPRPVPRRTRTP